MAYSLQGCGIVLKSDIEKRDRAYAKFGRTAADPVVSSLFIHSVCAQCVRSHRYLKTHIYVFMYIRILFSDPYLAHAHVHMHTHSVPRTLWVPISAQTQSRLSL